MKISKAEFISILETNTDSDFNFNLLTIDHKIDEIGIDSLGFVTFLWAIESRFDIKDSSYTENLTGSSTIADLISVYKELGYEIILES